MASAQQIERTVATEEQNKRCLAALGMTVDEYLKMMGKLNGPYEQACDQIILLQNEQTALEVRYQRALKQNNPLFIHNYFYKLQTIENIIRMFYKYAHMKSALIDEMAEKLSDATGIIYQAPDDDEYEPDSSDDESTDEDSYESDSSDDEITDEESSEEEDSEEAGSGSNPIMISDDEMEEDMEIWADPNSSPTQS